MSLVQSVSNHTSSGKIESFAPNVGAINKNPSIEGDYVLGHSQREIRRLTTQAALLRPITERLLQNAKLAPGMRVLDLGCGAGDVSMLAAEFVGSTGSV